MTTTLLIVLSLLRTERYGYASGGSKTNESCTKLGRSNKGNGKANNITSLLLG